GCTNATMAHTTENPLAKKSMMAANVTKPGRCAGLAIGCACPPAALALLVCAGLARSSASSGCIASDMLSLRFLQHFLAHRSSVVGAAVAAVAQRDRLGAGTLRDNPAPNPAGGSTGSMAPGHAAHRRLPKEQTWHGTCHGTCHAACVCCPAPGR